MRAACTATTSATDTDEFLEKRAERQVATLFGLSTIFVILFCVSYFVFKIGDNPTEILGYGASNVALGVTLGLALLCIGVGLIQWARKLMSDHEIVEFRHPGSSSDEDRTETVAILQTGLEESGIGRRPLIRNSLLGAMGALGIIAILPLRDLGPLPGDKLNHSVWKKGMRVVQDVGGNPIKPADMEIGQLVNGKLIFGPAARHLPQLPLALDDEGYLIATSDFTEAVGPSFWERDTIKTGE